MKKISIYVRLTLTLMLGGCSDFLDLSPYDQINSSAAFSTTSLAESTVAAVYGNLLYDYNNGDRSRINWDAFSSVMDPKPAHIHLNYSYLTGAIQSNNGMFLTYWKRYYEGINRANDVINHIGSCPTMSDEVKRQRIAECKFLRAYHYYRLNVLWRGVPIYLENLAPDEYTRGRATEEEVWQAILKDLDDCIACEDMPKKHDRGDSDYGRITKGAVYTLRGKVYMWQEKWADAEADFKQVGECGYKLANVDYADLFKEINDDCDEMIFTVQMEEVPDCGNTLSYSYGNVLTKGNGNSSFFMNTRFVDSYQWANGKPFNWDDVISGYNAKSASERSAYFLRDAMNTTEKSEMSTYGADMSLYLDAGNESRIKAAYVGRDPRLAATVITPYSTYVGGSSGVEQTYTARWPFRENVAPSFDLETRENSYFLYSIRKYVTVGNEYSKISCNPIDMPIFRYADVLLSLAEALNEQGKWAEAVPFINQVRERAGVAPLNETGNSYVSVSSSADLKERIYDEKRWELACEGQLYYDELRWGVWQEDKFSADNGSLEVWGTPVYKYSWGGDAYTKWAVPSAECEKNTSILQNENWY